jgi:hypothetical protein
VRLTVYNALGQDVAVLVDEEQPAGTHHVRFAAAGRPSGWYLVRVQAGRHQATRPVLLAR